MMLVCPRLVCSRRAGCGEAVSPLVFQPGDDNVEPRSARQIREHKRPITSHSAGVTVHNFKRRSHMRRQVDFVNHQQSAALDAGSALARDLVSAGHVDHVNEGVH